MGEMMLDLYVQPHLIHRLMAKILEAALRDLRAVEDSGLLSMNNYGGMRPLSPLPASRRDAPLQTGTSVPDPPPKGLRLADRERFAREYCLALCPVFSGRPISSRQEPAHHGPRSPLGAHVPR